MHACSARMSLQDFIVVCVLRVSVHWSYEYMHHLPLLHPHSDRTSVLLRRAVVRREREPLRLLTLLAPPVDAAVIRLRVLARRRPEGNARISSALRDVFQVGRRVGLAEVHVRSRGPRRDWSRHVREARADEVRLQLCGCVCFYRMLHILHDLASYFCQSVSECVRVRVCAVCVVVACIVEKRMHAAQSRTRALIQHMRVPPKLYQPRLPIPLCRSHLTAPLSSGAADSNTADPSIPLPVATTAASTPTAIKAAAAANAPARRTGQCAISVGSWRSKVVLLVEEIYSV